MERADRIRGGMLGLCTGDALGVPVEFKPRAARDADPVTDMRGHGTWNQPAGTWSDDSSMALCLLESLTEAGFDLADQGRRYQRWLHEAHWTAHGNVFDIGGTTHAAIAALDAGRGPEASGETSERSNGNGSLMRCLPVSIHAAEELDAVLLDRAHKASAVTHAHPRSQMACGLHALLTRHLLRGAAPAEAVDALRADARRAYASGPWAGELAHYALLLEGDLASAPRDRISGSGYVVHTLVASVWCLLTEPGYAEATLAAVNLGDDTDTTGAVTGGLAGVVHGVGAIPADWLATLARRADIEAATERFIGTLF